MPAPTNTYESTTDLSLGQVPQVDDQELYQALLDIHNAIESLVKGSDEGDSGADAYIAKQRSVTLPIVAAAYAVLITDGTILLDGRFNNVTAFLGTAVGFSGYTYTFKCIDDTNSVFVDTAVLTETLEGETDPFELFEGEYIDVTSDGINWRVML